MVCRVWIELCACNKCFPWAPWPPYILNWRKLLQPRFVIELAAWPNWRRQKASLENGDKVPNGVIPAQLKGRVWICEKLPEGTVIISASHRLGLSGRGTGFKSIFWGDTFVCTGSTINLACLWYLLGCTYWKLSIKPTFIGSTSLFTHTAKIANVEVWSSIYDYFPGDKPITHNMSARYFT